MQFISQRLISLSYYTQIEEDQIYLEHISRQQRPEIYNRLSEETSYWQPMIMTKLPGPIFCPTATDTRYLILNIYASISIQYLPPDLNLLFVAL